MSTSDDLQKQPPAQVRVLQIIVAAIALGPAAFLGIVLSTAPPGAAAANAGGNSMTYLACGMAVAAVLARLLAPSIVVRSQRRQIATGVWEATGLAPSTDAGKLGAVYSVRTIISIAILEGAAFFLVVAYQLERNPLALGAAVLLTLMIALHFPTRNRVAAWVERQLQRLDEDRQAAQLRR